MLFFGVFLYEAARTAAKSRTNRSTANGLIGPEVAPPSMFHRHNFIETLQVAIIAGSSPEISQTVRINCRSFLSRVRISIRPYVTEVSSLVRGSLRVHAIFSHLTLLSLVGNISFRW